MLLTLSETMCTICQDDLPRNCTSTVIFHCRHEFHVTCIRNYLRSIRMVHSNAVLRCPNCRDPVASSIVNDLCNELRNLKYRCILPPNVCRNPNLAVRVVWQRDGIPGTESFGSIRRIRELPEDRHHPGQVFITADLSVTVTDPRTRFWMWVQNADTAAVLTPIRKLTTTALPDSDNVPEGREVEILDLPSEDEEVPVGLLTPPPSPPPQQRPRIGPDRRRRGFQPRDDPILAAQRRQRRLLDDFRSRVSEVNAAVRRLENAVLLLVEERNSARPM